MKQQQMQYTSGYIALSARGINNAHGPYRYNVKTMVPHFEKQPFLAQKPR
jgi:hypothetical protein